MGESRRGKSGLRNIGSKKERASPLPFFYQERQMKRIMQMKRIVQNDQTAPWKRQSDCIRICRVRSESSYNAETLLREREVERERDLHTEE